MDLAEQVRHADVVGLERLPAAGHQHAVAAAEDEARGGEALGAVGARGLALQDGRLEGGAGLGAVRLVGGLDLGVVEQRDDGRRVEPVDRGRDLGDGLVGVHQPVAR